MLTQKTELVRKRLSIATRNHHTISIDNKPLINFCSNDYLCLGSHALLKKAFIQGVQRYGLGSGSSPFVSGYYKAHQRLEEKFADFFQRERVILFNSGYLANIGIIRALMHRHGNIMADKLCHASLLDGIQLSRAKCVRYAHNDLIQLDTLLQKTVGDRLLVSEGVFSMEGDITPLDKITRLAKKHQALCMVDDAHGAGVLGKHGKGIIEHFNLKQEDIACLVVPLGKAFASMGAAVSGSHDLMESILQFSRSYCYSTALPPAIAHATLTSLKLIEEESWRRHKLNALIAYFIKEARIRSLKLVSDDLTPIKSIVTGDNLLALKIRDTVLQQGYFIASIRPPTVAHGTARIRISLNCLHSEVEISQLLDLIAIAYHRRQ